MKSLDLHLDPSSDPAPFDGWKASLAALYEIALPRNTRFRITGRNWQLPHGFLSTATMGPLILARPVALVAQSPVDQINIFRLVKGEVRADYAGRPVLLRAGDLLFNDYMRPSASRARAFSCQSVSVARLHVPLRARDGHLHGTVLQGSSPVGMLLGRQFDALVAAMDGLDPLEADAAVMGFADLALRLWPEPAGKTAAADLVDRAMGIIQAELGNPDLSPRLLANRIGISRTILYEAFEPVGGIRALMQQARLEASLKVLATKRWNTGLVGEVASRHGFKTIASFSRSFSARFGRSPIEVAHLARDRVASHTIASWLEGPGTEADADTLLAWLDRGARDGRGPNVGSGGPGRPKQRRRGQHAAGDAVVSRKPGM